MAVRPFYLASSFSLLFIAAICCVGCGTGDGPVTAESSKFKPVDSAAEKPAAGPANESANVLPNLDPTLPTQPATVPGEAAPAPGNAVTANTTPGEKPAATPATVPGAPKTPENGTEITVTREVRQLIANIEQLSQAEPPGNTREEQLENLVQMQRKIIEHASLLLSTDTDPRVHKMAVEAATQSLAMLAQIGDPSAPTRMSLFAKALAKHPTNEIARTGRLLTFNMDIIGKLNSTEKVDTELVLKEIETLLKNDGGEVDTFQVATSVCQFLNERGEAAAAAKGMRLVAEAYKDSPNADLAKAAQALPETARLVELDLPQQLSNVLDKKEGAEEKLVTDLEKLIQVKNPAPVFVQPMLDMLKALESAGKTESVLKLVGMLETAYSTHEDAAVSKFVNEQIVAPSRKRYGLVGQPFAPQAVGFDGKELDLKSLAGKVILVSLWSTTAQNSMAEIPVLRKLHEDLAAKGFTVLGLDVDINPKRVEQFMSYQGESIPYPNYLSPEVVRGEKLSDWHETSLAKEFGLASLPVYYLVGKDGKIDSLYHFKLDPERLGGRLKELLGLEEAPIFAVKPKPMVIENPTLPKAAPLPTEPPPPVPEAPKPAPPKQGRLFRPSLLEQLDRQLGALLMSGRMDCILFAEEEPAKKEETPKEGNPYLAKPGQSATQLTDWVLRMLDKPKTIQGRPGFAAAIVDACDRVLADKSAKETEQLVAIENKLAILHKAACAGDDAMDKQLAAFVAQLKDDSRPRIARETAFFVQERKVLDASEAKPEEIAALLKEMQDYYAKEKLASKHLRMASATVDLVNKLEDGDAREKHFTDFGNLFAKSSDKELARYGKKLAKKPATKESDLIGKPLELAGNTAGGLPFAWEKYRGKVVIVDFWATWCGPCLKEMPNVKAFRDKHKDKGFEVVGVSVDKDLDALETFLDENDLPWETLAGDEAQAAADKYGVRAIPTMMLIDQKGNVVAVAHNIAALAPEAEKLLAANAKK
jgi:thiol-disulfide isomerase/thioredoxin